MAMTKTVGVLGGLGPEATLDFFAKILAKTGAKSDQEHLHLIINNNPKVPNRNDAVAGRGPSAGPALAASAAALERADVDFMVMVCNAAHAFKADIEAVIRVPFVSIIDETARETLRRLPQAQRVGVLASSGCLDAKLYQTAFVPHRIEVIVPEGEQRESFMRLLYRIKSGDKGEEVRAGMRALGQALIDSGAEALIAGCTEVPLVLFDGDLSAPLINSTDVLVDSTIAYAKGERPLLEVKL